MPFEFLVSPDSEERFAALRALVAGAPPAAERVVLGASREAVDDLVRGIAAGSRATFGIYRFTLLGLAARLAAQELAAEGLAHSTRLIAEATAARAVFEALGRRRLRYFAPVASAPNFARALAATLDDLRLEGVAPERLAALDGPGADLAELLALFEEQARAAGVADRAAILRAAARGLAGRSGRWIAGLPIALSDVAIGSRAERELVAALAAGSPRVLCTVPAGDERTARALEAIGAVAVSRSASAAPSATGAASRASGALARLRDHLFSPEAPPSADVGEGVSFFSAPGEGRECVEIARRIQEEAARGVALDEIAVFVRSPELYGDLLEHALRRARVPAYFAFGARRPHPAGRAFLALLACRAEGLSARRFAEYLSLGQVPDVAADGGPPSEPAPWTAPADEALGVAGEPPAEPGRPETGADPLANDGEGRAAAEAASGSGEGAAASSDPDAPVHGGSLRAPRRWEDLLVEAAVIGGKHRWEKRLEGLGQQWRMELRALASDEPESPRIPGLERDLEDLEHLRRFALPVIEALASLPASGTWGEWLAALQALAAKALRASEAVLRVLAELAPMAAVGPVGLDEVCAVLGDRLTTLPLDPPKRRYGRVLVAGVGEARGRSFAVVFVPGLAERLFPQKPREDPMLLDAHRTALAEASEGEIDLVTQTDRGHRERLLLRVAVGAARERVHLSYPRVEVAQERPRVPSFYGLDVMRALTGSVPSSDVLEQDAAVAGGARLAWPAPALAERAIDEAEHDLAVLGRLLFARAPASAGGAGQVTRSDVEGRARYLLELNPHLARSLRSRWQRWESRVWNAADGLVRPRPATLEALGQHRLRERPYSVSALQRFAACPYRFLLSAILRLSPRAEPTRAEQLDPLTRGELFHEVQALALRGLDAAGKLPIHPAGLAGAKVALDATLDEVAAQYADRLAPPIPRVWQDEIERMRIDLHGWLDRVAEASREWIPIRFELGFGIDRGRAQADAASAGQPAVLPGGYRLRGAIDLIERARDRAVLRVTDYKTGADATRPGLVVGGGEVLQPVLYSLAAEALLGSDVQEARLFFCTARGGFTERTVAMDEGPRRLGLKVLEAVDGAVERGFLPPLPKKDACLRCDYRVVCGPNEEVRAVRKGLASIRDLEPMRALEAVRSMP